MTDLAQCQRDFAAYLRDPRQPAPPGVDARRLKLYRDLVLNNLENLLAKAFPVLQTVLPPAGWRALVGDFCREHRAHTPSFLRLPGEFVDYLQAGRAAADDLPFLSELADYEWRHLEVTLALDVVVDRAGLHADLLAGQIVLNPVLRLCTYQFPVHTLSPGHAATCAPARSFLAVYRGVDESPKCAQLTPVTARLVALMADPQVGRGCELLAHLARELAHPDPASLVAAGREILEELRRREIVLGARHLN
ncbi:MAG: DUF2063 domain-containing protein [Gammaproteobacteria bacterium]|nr:DUF2063 domain-containing protein [Gammaproteobacteria bacterium]